MENNFTQPQGNGQDQFPSFGPAQQQAGPQVPPPPATGEQVGVRTMDSDIESVRQSGGEQPQSHVVSAGETPAQTPFSFQPPFQPATDAPQQESNVQTSQPKGSFTIKTVLLIVGIIVLAIAVGFGVFYLVRSLNSSPEIPTPEQAQELPVQEQPIISPETTPIAQEVVVPQVFVHTSMFSGIASTTVTLPGLDLISLRAAITSSSQEQKLVVGSIRDISFVTTDAAPVESPAIIQALLPSIASNLTPLVDRDITAWLYGDKSGGNKFGLILPLLPTVTKDQINFAFTALEAAPNDVLNLFIPTVKLPTKPVFKEGLIGEVMVRYLAISTTNQQVFEYTPVSINGKGYVIITSSYNQMVDVLKRLGAKPLTIPVTSTVSTTSSTPTTIPTVTPTITP